MKATAFARSGAAVIVLTLPVVAQPAGIRCF
jgi:hypothetical protein